ncbi:MAG: hypothetical protein MOGMAGMI_00905 [Candidatus Omnitrophica bacterium]|nr:hypothetical protein [Candidatus Omnitrophota bacterium]
MSIHSSLRSGGADRRHRSVLKRHERLKVLRDKNIWSEDRPVTGLQKVKMQKVKVKKEKAAAPAAGAAAPAAGAAASAGAKAAAPAAKAAAPKK